MILGRVAPALALLLLLLGAGAARAETVLPPIGGPGGGPFTQRCPAGQILFGVAIRAGDDVDAIRPVCAPPIAPDEVKDDMPIGAYAGGPGGSPIRLDCPIATGAVTHMYIAYEGVHTVIVNNIHLFCDQPDGLPRPQPAAPAASFDGPPAQHDSFPATFVTIGDGTAHCPPGLVATGLTGRGGVFLDAVSLVCDVSPLVHTVHSIGRRNGTGNGAPAPAPKATICLQAEDAVKRNSPIAQQLVAACLKQKSQH